MLLYAHWNFKMIQQRNKLRTAQVGAPLQTKKHGLLKMLKTKGVKNSQIAEKQSNRGSLCSEKASPFYVFFVSFDGI